MAERYDFYVHDNRKITFNLTEPIMREDSGVTDFVFHIPKILNELEVSDWQWWLVFVNAKKEKYSIALTLSDDPERPLEYNLATYTVDYAMSIKAGAVQFALEAINTGTGGAIDNEWHTLTYETKVKETLQGNQAEYAETESDIISALIQEVRTKMNQVIGGATPTPVASVSAMTDPSKLYLLTTDGEWYYYNGTAWVSGGVYGAEITDPVPTQGSTNAVSSGGVYSALADVNSDVADLDLRVEELEQGGSGGLSMTAVNLLNTILTEAVYGSDQTANIALLYKELSNVAPVSISAVLDGTALAGQDYSELSFIVTVTFDDDSTQVVDNYTIVTTGTVTAGSNTVTIRYRGATTTCTFTAEQVVTYSITYNLTDVTSSNRATLSKENERYATEIAVVDSDHYISTFTVTMGGVDVTSTVRNGNNIVIDAVTGNVVITVVANAYVYLNLVTKRPHSSSDGDSTTYCYSDAYTTLAKTIAYNHVGKITEYPAKYDCTLTFTITNISNEAVNISNLGVGLVSGAQSEYISTNSIAYWQAITNSGNSLEAGASLSGTYSMRAGWQLLFTVLATNMDALEINVRGDYVADTFDEYTYVYSVDSATENLDNTYRNYTYYSDDGTTTLKAYSGTPTKVATNLAVGIYDIVTRTVYTEPESNVPTNCLTEYSFGAMAEPGAIASNYAIFYKPKYATENVWYYGQIRVTSDGSYLTFSSAYKSRLTPARGEHVEIRMKEVSA